MRWQVTGQRPGGQNDANGNPVMGMNVTVQTDNGHTLQVFIPNDQYNPEQARQIISERVATVNAVGSLTGET